MSTSRPIQSAVAFASLISLVALGAGASACSGSTSVTDTSDAADASQDATADDDSSVGLDVAGFDGDPTIDVNTCAGAAKAKSYIGCDYWPTVVANQVWSIFDFAVVVANAGTTDADVQLTGPAGFSSKVTVKPGDLAKIYLPWVSALKGPDSDACGDVVASGGSVIAKASAYHLVSTRPVSVYQFNPLEYKPAGGPPSKDWTKCPAKAGCGACFSYSNDASLLLPTTAMTGNYRVAGIHGWTSATGPVSHNSFVTITATRNGTTLKLQVGKNGKVLAGAGVAETGPGGILSLSLDEGDVAQLLGDAKTTSDLSGSLLEASAPVQVITGAPCIENPIGSGECDHVEESVFPAETLGKHYAVTVPTGPHGNVVGHVVRIFGHVDGTSVTYDPAPPTGAPTTLNAGDVVDLGVVKVDFVMTGDKPFAVGSFQLGSSLADPAKQEGDPSESFSTAIEQYRRHYVFLAPDDYIESYADVIAPTGAVLTLDGTTAVETPTSIGASGFAVVRVKLGAGVSGAHVLDSTLPVGIQISGYGLYTSYQYPGGANLDAIAEPPPVIH